MQHAAQKAVAGAEPSTRPVACADSYFAVPDVDALRAEGDVAVAFRVLLDTPTSSLPLPGMRNLSMSVD